MHASDTEVHARTSRCVYVCHCVGATRARACIQAYVCVWGGGGGACVSAPACVCTFALVCVPSETEGE